MLLQHAEIIYCLKKQFGRGRGKLNVMGERKMLAGAAKKHLWNESAVGGCCQERGNGGKRQRAVMEEPRAGAACIPAAWARGEGGSEGAQEERKDTGRQRLCLQSMQIYACAGRKWLFPYLMLEAMNRRVISEKKHDVRLQCFIMTGDKGKKGRWLFKVKMTGLKLLEWQQLHHLLEEY